MGKVIVPATIENLEDLLRVERGEISHDAVRRVVVNEAIVDPGVVRLSLPRRYIDQLGLYCYSRRRLRARGQTNDTKKLSGYWHCRKC
jgi:hypothetical protein